MARFRAKHAVIGPLEYAQRGIGRIPILMVLDQPGDAGIVPCLLGCERPPARMRGQALQTPQRRRYLVAIGQTTMKPGSDGFEDNVRRTVDYGDSAGTAGFADIMQQTGGHRIVVRTGSDQREIDIERVHLIRDLESPELDGHGFGQAALRGVRERRRGGVGCTKRRPGLPQPISPSHRSGESPVHDLLQQVIDGVDHA